MKSEICSLYEDLNKLLSDICELLSEEVKNNGISLKNRNVANQLIERSKKQLQNISRVASSAADNDSGSYMDMNKAPEYIDPDKKLHEENQEIYSDVEVFVEAENIPKEGQIICPYELTPAQQVPYVTKYGYLDRKEKFLFIEHQKRIFAAISKPWMMIYSCDKDLKPNETLDLRTYQAKTNENQRDSKKKEEKCFELVSLKKTKSYQFTASTPKDMLQWVAEIERVNPTYQNFITAIVSEKPVEDTDDENIYEKLRDNEQHHETNVNFNNKVLKQPPLPSLPPRIARNHYIIERPVPNVPLVNKEKAKTPEVNNKSKENSLDKSQSFSDDDPDDTYDELIMDFQPEKRSAIQNISSQEVEEEEEEVEYDMIQTDMIHTPKNNNKEQTISPTSGTSTKEIFCPNPVNNKLDEDEDDPEQVYDLIQTDVQMPAKPLLEENKEKTERVKPEIPKAKPPVKPKVFQLAGKDAKANSKISSLVQQLTKK